MMLKCKDMNYQTMIRNGFFEQDKYFVYAETLDNFNKIIIFIDRENSEIEVCLKDEIKMTNRYYPKDKFTKKEIRDIENILGIFEIRGLFIRKDHEINLEYEIGLSLKKLSENLGDIPFQLLVANNACPDDFGLDEMECNENRDCLKCWKKSLSKYS